MSLSGLSNTPPAQTSKLSLARLPPINFVGMVFPGDELDARTKHTAMHNGKFVVGITTVNQGGEKVLEGTVEVAQPPTVYAKVHRSRVWEWICHGITPPWWPEPSGILPTRT